MFLLPSLFAQQVSLQAHELLLVSIFSANFADMAVIAIDSYTKIGGILQSITRLAYAQWR